MFQVKDKYFEDEYGSTNKAIRVWKSKGISNQNLNSAGGIAGELRMSKPIKPAYAILDKKQIFQQKKIDVIKNRSIVNIYIVYELSLKTLSSNNVLRNSLFGATEVTKPNNTTDPHKYK